MSYKEGDQIHIEDDDAMAASKTGHLRWILGVSLFLVIGFLSAIWIFGAWSQGNTEEEATVTAVMEDAQDAQDEGDGTDGVVLDADEATVEGAADVVEDPAEAE